MLFTFEKKRNILALGDISGVVSDLLVNSFNKTEVVFLPKQTMLPDDIQFFPD